MAPLTALWLAATPVQALGPGEMLDDPAREARARDIGRELRCLVCRNQSIFDSDAGLARDLRAVVRERIRAGDSDAEVLDFVRARYGDFVLLSPPVQGSTTALWLAPFALLLIGGCLAAVFLVRPRHAPSSSTDEALGLEMLERERR